MTRPTFDLDSVPADDRARVEALIPDPRIAGAYVHRNVDGISDFELFDVACEEQENVMLSGPTGSSKTSVFRAYAAERQLPFVLVECNAAMDPGTILGRTTITGDGEVRWIDGDFTLVVRYGGVVLIDEINMAHPRITAGFHQLLAVTRRMSIPEAGETVIAGRGGFGEIQPTLFASAYNPRYQGTVRLSEALSNRFALQLDWDYERAVEEQLIASTRLLDMADNIRSLAEIRTPLSTNALMEFERHAGRFGLTLASRLLVNRFAPEERARSAGRSRPTPPPSPPSSKRWVRDGRKYDRAVSAYRVHRWGLHSDEVEGGRGLRVVGRALHHDRRAVRRRRERGVGAVARCLGELRHGRAAGCGDVRRPHRRGRSAGLGNGAGPDQGHPVMADDRRKGTTKVTVDLSKFDGWQQLRLTRLARELRLTDQILSDDLDTVTIQQDGPAPAWTTLEGDQVAFAMAKMPFPRTRLDIAVWLGTNAHELGHVLFSPRRDSLLMRRVIQGNEFLMPRLMDLHNIIEDQRQERLILARFSPWRAYLTAALGHHLKADNDSAWLLMAGRTWLADSVRAEAQRRFAASQGTWMADEVAGLIGAYQRLNDPGEYDSEEAWDILARLHDLLGSKIPEVRQCVVMERGDPDTNDPDAASVPMTADEAGDPGVGGDGPVSFGDSPGSGYPDGENEGGYDNPDQAGQGGGAGDAPGDPNRTPANIQEALRDALKDDAKAQIDAEEATADDLDSILDALTWGRGASDADGRAPIGHYVEVTDEARRLHHEVSDALLDLKDASEPGWVRRVDYGRLNVRRLINPNIDPDELFDRYDPGQMDASEMEVVLLIDVSGSMAQQVIPLGEATWAIRHAVDDLEGRITVLAYESGPHQVVAEPGVRPDDRMYVPDTMGGTEPTTAIKEAWKVIGESQARNRLLIVLTDGAWHTANGDKLIEAMGESGVVTVMALLNASPRADGTGPSLHGCQFGAVIADPLELARLFHGWPRPGSGAGCERRRPARHAAVHLEAGLPGPDDGSRRAWSYRSLGPGFGPPAGRRGGRPLGRRHDVPAGRGGGRPAGDLRPGALHQDPDVGVRQDLADHPHEYVVISRSSDWREHLRFLQWLRHWGELELFKGRHYPYRTVDGFRYWAMSLEHTIINRRKAP